MFANSKFTTKISSRERYALLAINILIYCIYGIIAGSFGVAFKTLQTNFGFSTNMMSVGLALQAIGGCVSAAIATFALDKFNRQIQFCFVTLYLGLLTLIIPFSNFLPLFLFVNAAIGFFCILIDCISNAWIVELFRPEEHVFIQILHFFFAFGTTFSPFLLGPFLNKPTDEESTVKSFDVLIDNFTTTSTLNSTDLSTIELPVSTYFIADMMKKSNIWISFVILGVSMLIASAIHFLLFLIKPYKELEKKQKVCQPLPADPDPNNNLSQPNLEKSSNNLIPIVDAYQGGHDKKSKNLSKGYYIFFVAMIILIVTFEVANEVNAINYLALTISKSFIHLSEEEAGYTFGILQFVITGTRFVNIFLSFKVNVVANIFFNFLAMVSGCVILMMSISTNLFAFKFGIALLGLGYSSTYPLLISFVEQRITLTNQISSIMAFSSVFGLCVTPFIIGNFIDDHPISFIYISLFIAIVSLSSFTFLYVMEVLRLRKL